jgi:hypothetical protein
MTKYTVLHVGYPVAGRPIRDDEWKVYSAHKTESAAWKKIFNATSHLSHGSWDDHYRVIAPDGTNCELFIWLAKEEDRRARREWRSRK